jgi:peptidoglycan-N-acetylglucosamine deacetylase
MTYRIKYPYILRSFMPAVLYRANGYEKVLYITFDDGPDPLVTPKVLDILDQFGAKATFFCLGKQVKENPELFRLLREKGHAVGNHSFSHVNGWKTKNMEYLDDIEKADMLIQSNLFRPPYGRLKFRQYLTIRDVYQIVLWDVISADFDPAIGWERCVENVINNAQEGSVIVFHDALHAWPRLEKALPAVLDLYSKQGFAFKVIESH